MPARRTLLAAYDQELRRDVVFPDMRREIHDGLITHTSLLGGAGCILGGGGDAHNRIEEEIEYFEVIGQDFDWLVYDHDPVADSLSRELLGRGFRRSQAQMVWVREAAGGLPAVYPGLEVRPVKDRESAALAAAVQERIRGRELPALRLQLQERLRHQPESLGAFVVVCDGAPAGSGWVTFSGSSRFGTLIGGGVVAVHARRGVYRALLEARARDAAARRATHLVAGVAPGVSERMKRLGFQLLTRMTRYRYTVPRPI